MSSSQKWGAETARHYDEPGSPMFSPELLAVTTGFLADLAGDGRALELAIGTGRVAIPLADRGVPVVGIEFSEHMAAVLREKVAAERIPVTIGDMATARVPGDFALVYLVYNTLSNLLTQEEQVQCFVNAARHLSPGGRFVIELGVPPLRRMPPGQSAVPFSVSSEHIGIDTIDPVTQRQTSHHYWPQSGRHGRSEHRYLWPAECDLMARIAGMELERRVADWDGSPFTAESASHVSVWRKA
ncbi:class I SAM-dependent methyltransferase [Bogoriella caseilytica]|uniref:Methyltransferase family protein n=1 Tax=Bogoriella caseilytica TaxID=56055 RepID=A0A3N2BCN4_9MICO|nr:class I SAM-dependent methyltransferase [Bogoriella caseilytica]ROR72824.1 methyltransferase family protein [Bogoriella caseilytica]